MILMVSLFNIRRKSKKLKKKPINIDFKEC